MKTQKANDADHGAQPALNHAMLDAYAKRRTGLLERLINAYLDEAPRFHQLIRQGMDNDDLSLVKLNAHALKSSSHNLGATRLSKLCQEIELAADQNQSSPIGELVERLGPECFEVEEGLKTVLLQEKAKAVAV